MRETHLFVYIGYIRLMLGQSSIKLMCVNNIHRVKIEVERESIQIRKCVFDFIDFFIVVFFIVKEFDFQSRFQVPKT